MGFDEAKFLEAAREIDNVNLDGYEFFTESLKETVQCKIYRKYDEVSVGISVGHCLRVKCNLKGF